MADEFSYLTDSEDERAVEDVLSQAMDHTVLEQIAAINCSSFSTSDNLPFDLENRFRKLKSSKSKSFKPRSSDDSSLNSLKGSHNCAAFERIPDLKNCSPEDPEEYSGRNQTEIKGTDSRSKLKSSSNSNKFCETESIKSKSKSKSRTTGLSESSSSTDGSNSRSKPKSSSNRKENRKTKSLKSKSRTTGSSESSSSTDDAEEYSDGSNSRSKPKSSSNRKENRKTKSLKLKSRTGSNSRSKPKSSSNRKENRKTKSLKLNSRTGSSEWRCDSSPESRSVSPARRVIGCLWCSPKKEKRKQGKENQLSSFSSSWGNEYDVDFLKTFSMKEQNKIMKKAIKEEEKINKEAEKIVKWAEQASSRMMDVSGFESLDDQLTDHEK